MFALGEMKDYTKLWLRTNEEFLKRVNTYRELVQAEAGGVYVLFSQTYTDTQRFVEEHGYDVAKGLYKHAVESLNAWVAKQPSGPVRDDAESFAKDCLERISMNLSRTETTFNEFVSRHKDKFFGPVGPSIKEALSERQSWDLYLSNLRSKDVESKLRQFRAEATTFFTVDIDGPVSKNIDEIRFREDLLNDDEQRACIAELDRYTSEIKRQLQERVEELVKAMEESERTLSDDELEELFDRIAVEDKIKTA
jgi:hypothetical protein